MHEKVYSGIDYHFSICHRDVPLEVPGDVLEKGRRMHFVSMHPIDDTPGITSSPNCPTSGRFVKYQETTPTQRRD